LVQLQSDPFFSPPSASCLTNCNDLIALATPLVLDGENVGIFGAHLQASAFQKIVEPMAVIDQSWFQQLNSSYAF
jgi:hypothetical protein